MYQCKKFLLKTTYDKTPTLPTYQPTNTSSYTTPITERKPILNEKLFWLKSKQIFKCDSASVSVLKESEREVKCSSFLSYDVTEAIH